MAGQAPAREQEYASKRGERYAWKRPEGVNKFSPLPVEGWSAEHLPSDKQRQILVALQAFADQDRQPRTGNRIAPRASYRRISRYCSLTLKVNMHVDTVRRNIPLMIDKELIAPWNVIQKQEDQPEKGESRIGRRRGEGNREATWYVIRSWSEVLDRLQKKANVGRVHAGTEAFHFATFGRRRTLMTQQQIDSWGVQAQAEWRLARAAPAPPSGPELVSRPKPPPAQQPNPPPDLEPLREAIALNCHDKLIDDRILEETWKVAQTAAGGELRVADAVMLVRHMWETHQERAWCDRPIAVATAIGGKVRAWLNKKRAIDAANARDARERHERDVEAVREWILAAEMGDEPSKESLHSVGPELIAEARKRLRGN